jgi:transposase
VLSFAGRRIFLARAATDMRRGVDTLAALVQNQIGRDPYQGEVFVFVSRDRRRVKVLVWDLSGFWLCAKRLESGTFALPRSSLIATSGASIALSAAQVQMLLEGIDVHRATYHGHYHREDGAQTADRQLSESPSP